MKIKNIIVILTETMLIQSSYACTTAASPNSANDSVIIMKNRDEHPDLQSVVAFKPANGFEFLALVSHKKESDPYVVRSGINQYGLAIVNMAASVLANDPTFKDRYDDGDDFMQDVLKNNMSVSDVLSTLPEFVKLHPYPEFYLLADREQVALIELGTDGKYSVEVSNNDPIYHTNHYVSPGLYNDNTMYYESSMNRYTRIAELMNSTSNYSLDTFTTFAHNHAAGSNDSIFRTGMNPGDPTTPRTLATFMASIPKNSADAPTVAVQFYPEPNISGPTYTYTLTPDFWNFAGSEKVMNVEGDSK